jgi:hypothetical protein
LLNLHHKKVLLKNVENKPLTEKYLLAFIEY